MDKTFYEAIEERRSIYGINKDPLISDNRLKEIIDFCVKNTPSAFNSQNSNEEKNNSFMAGYGTIVFFEDIDVITALQAKYKIYSANIPVWTQQTIGILQYIIWTSLSIEGYGASLQHYRELIDMTIKKELNIPSSWKMIAKMPFGKATTSPFEKKFESLEKRVMLFN